MTDDVRHFPLRMYSILPLSSNFVVFASTPFLFIHRYLIKF